MDEKDRKPLGGWRLVTGPIPLPADGLVFGPDGWLIPSNATREDIRAAVQQGTAEVRQEIDQLRAELAARPAVAEPSPTHVIVGNGAPSPALLDVKGCAAVLGISVRSWQRLVENGEAPKPVKLRKSSRWLRSDVEAFVASRR